MLLAAAAVVVAAAVAAISSSAATSTRGSSATARTSLTIVYRPHGSLPLHGEPTPTLRWTLTCDPVGGTLPARTAACHELSAHGEDLIDPGIQCMVIVLGGATSTVTGTWEGHAVHFVSSTCDRAWSTLPAVLTGSTAGR